MTEKKRELIKTIAVIPSNFEYIAKTGIINGTLLVEIERVMEAYAAQQKPPSSATAEEIIESILESLGDPINIHNHAFEIRPYTVDHKTEWWIFHKEVASGEPLAQWLDKFAALHAQQKSEIKMPTELEIHDKAYGYCMMPSMPDGEPEADMQIYEAFCDGVEWLRNQIEKR